MIRRFLARLRHPLALVHPGEWEHEDTLRRALHAAVDCPCCTAAPYTVNDCTCRLPCGKRWCQAIDLPEWLPGDHRG